MPLKTEKKTKIWSSEKFRTLREKRFPDRGGLTRAAEAIGMTPANLQRYEQGLRTPGVNAAAAMARLVGVTIDDLLA